MDVATVSRWSAPPRSPRAIPGVVDLWRADLDAAAGGESGLEGLLCDEERARAAHVVPFGARARWARSRGTLRAVLGRYLDADPRVAVWTAELDGGPGVAAAIAVQGSEACGLRHLQTAPTLMS